MSSHQNLTPTWHPPLIWPGITMALVGNQGEASKHCSLTLVVVQAPWKIESQFDLLLPSKVLFAVLSATLCSYGSYIIAYGDPGHASDRTFSIWIFSCCVPHRDAPQWRNSRKATWGDRGPNSPWTFNIINIVLTALSFFYHGQIISINFLQYLPNINS